MKVFGRTIDKKNQQLTEYEQNPVTNKYLNILPLHAIEILTEDFPANIYF